MYYFSLLQVTAKLLETIPLSWFWNWLCVQKPWQLRYFRNDHLLLAPLAIFYQDSLNQLKICTSSSFRWLFFKTRHHFSPLAPKVIISATKHYPLLTIVARFFAHVQLGSTFRALFSHRCPFPGYRKFTIPCFNCSLTFLNHFFLFVCRLKPW